VKRKSHLLGETPSPSVDDRESGTGIAKREVCTYLSLVRLLFERRGGREEGEWSEVRIDKRGGKGGRGKREGEERGGRTKSGQPLLNTEEKKGSKDLPIQQYLSSPHHGRRGGKKKKEGRSFEPVRSSAPRERGERTRARTEGKKRLVNPTSRQWPKARKRKEV